MRVKLSEQLVTTLGEAAENVRTFAEEVAREPRLQARLSHVHAWYALQQDDRTWLFGPSKFVGYRNNSAKQYLLTYNLTGGADGRETERRLERWFQFVEPSSRLGKELFRQLGDFLAVWGRAPRKGTRISVATSALDQLPEAQSERFANKTLLARITSDASICGGSPCIKGTRMRVSDILDMLASGATRAEILSDFPYLAEDDIAAALAYAARASDHRVIRAA